MSFIRTGKGVRYNTGTANTLALVKEIRSDGKIADLIVFDERTGASSLEEDVPRRDPADYGEEGGGRTWTTL